MSHDDGSQMNLALTSREIGLILEWKGEAFWPDEERVLRKLRRALEGEGGELGLSRLQVGIISGWIEEQVGSHRGGGDVMNPEESLILGKLRAALEGD